jgi:hypothetical protein
MKYQNMTLVFKNIFSYQQVIKILNGFINKNDG